MGKMIAIGGKGGIGKTTITALITKVFSKRMALELLIVDADPSINLTLMLGMDINKTISNLRDKFITNSEAAQEAMFGNKHIGDTIYNDCLQNAETFKLLTMGRPEGPGCFCSVNNLLRYGIDSISNKFDITIIDCEAGIEQVNRKVTKEIDELILVVEPTIRSVQTAVYIKDIAEKYGVKKTFKLRVIINKVDNINKIGTIKSLLKRNELELAGIIPLDKNINKYDLIGKSLFDLPNGSPSLKSIRKILDKLYYDSQIKL